MNKEVGNRIKLLRKKKGLNQAQLASAIGLTPSAVSNYEQGTREPNGDTLKAMVEVLETTPDYILWGKESVASSRPLITPEDLEKVQDAVHVRLCEPVFFDGKTYTPTIPKELLDYLCSTVLETYADVKGNETE